MERERRGGLVFPVLLISAGFLLLLNTLGIIDWSLWSLIATLWPVILIAIGLDLLIGRRSMLGSLLVAGLTLVILFGSVRYLAGDRSGSVEVVPHTISQSLGGATRADITITADAGRLQIGPLPGSDGLIAGVLALRSDRRPAEMFDVDGGTAAYRLQVDGPSLVLAPTLGRDAGEEWSLRLNPTIPLALHVRTGVAGSHLNLERLNLSRLDVNVGVGATEIVLPEAGRFEAEIKSGIGAVNLRIPKGMAARIEAGDDIGRLDVSGDFTRRGTAYVSPNYDDASSRADIHIDTGLGKVTVEPYRGE